MSKNFVRLLEKAKKDIDNEYGHINEFGDYTVRISMKELKKTEEFEWRFWANSALDIINDEEERKNFEENGIIEYAFDLRYRATTTIAYDANGQEIMFGNVQSWGEVSEEECNFWGELLEWLIQKEKELNKGYNNANIS